MSSFLDFISEDIDAKKSLVSAMPLNNKRDIKKLNEKVALFEDKYLEYQKTLKKYIDTKSKSFEVKVDSKDLDKVTKKINELEHVRFVLNPNNTYFEKVGLDNLIYQLANYNDFSFEQLMGIIEKLLEKFALASIKLTEHDFNYTHYVHEYMKEFLIISSKSNKNYSEISETFEKVYWSNPDIIKHIELNFRRLIRKHENTFSTYIETTQKSIIQKNNVNSYEECLKLLKQSYYELNELNKESIMDIVELAKTSAIDINHYFSESKVLSATYSELMIDSVNLDDEVTMNKFYETLKKLKFNLEEYNSYLKFTPLMNEFKTTYEKELKNVDGKEKDKGLKIVTGKILALENKLDKLNKQISGGGKSLFGLVQTGNINKLKVDTIKVANELYELYKEHDQEYFKFRVISVLHPSFSTYELLHLYYSFDYFKKISLKKVYSIESYDELIKMSEDFDLFAMNPTNVIINSVPVFEKNNIGKVIMNKYRLDNVNVTEDVLEDIDSFIAKIELLLRVKEINDSALTVDKIWFMAQVEKIDQVSKKQTN